MGSPRSRAARKKPKQQLVAQCEWGRHQWIDAPSKSRPGWLATYCKVCKKFLGRCPSDTVKFDRPERGPGGMFVSRKEKR
jgi:hypothetical protein